MQQTAVEWQFYLETIYRLRSKYDSDICWSENDFAFAASLNPTDNIRFTEPHGIETISRWDGTSGQIRSDPILTGMALGEFGFGLHFRFLHGHAISRVRRIN
jgi:hypothetical protein